jgi:histidine triad (HIT) family protein
VFCDYAGPSPVLYDDASGFVIEPIAPVTPGHVLVISKYHIQDFVEDETFFGETAMVATIYARMLGMGDCNLITSRGEAATQTVKHLHLHLIPRFAGDGLKLPWWHG